MCMLWTFRFGRPRAVVSLRLTAAVAVVGVAAVGVAAALLVAATAAWAAWATGALGTDARRHLARIVTQ